MLNSLFSYERSTRPLSSVALSSSKVSSISAFCAFSTLVMSLLLASSVTGQTIWEENFEDETVASTSSSSLVGNNWSATSGGTGSSTMSILSGNAGLGFQFSAANQNGKTFTCTIASEAIDITGYEELAVSVSVQGNGGNPTILSSVSSDGSSAIVSITIDMPKNQSRIIDDIILTGSCTPFDLVRRHRWRWLGRFELDNIRLQSTSRIRGRFNRSLR